MPYRSGMGWCVVPGRTSRLVRVTFHLVVSILFLFASSPTTFARDGAVTEIQIKCAFLYNFAKFVQWPPSRFSSPTSPLVVGVIGDNPFGDLLQQLQGKNIGGHPILIKQLDFDAIDEARSCHVLFINAKHNKAAYVVEQVRDANVLTITDEIDAFPSVGAVINLRKAEDKVHFEINVDAARRAELKINSSLLNLAKIVRDGRA